MIIGWRSFAPNGTEGSGFLLYELSFPAVKQQHFQKQETMTVRLAIRWMTVTILSNLLLRSFLFFEKGDTLGIRWYS